MLLLHHHHHHLPHRPFFLKSKPSPSPFCKIPFLLSKNNYKMALKAVHVSDVPNLDHVPDNASLFSTRSFKGADVKTVSSTSPGNKFVVVGHRGNGMNILTSNDKRMKYIKENSISSFNHAASFPIDFIEFDVQVTKDGCPIIFHDNFILSEENGSVFEKRVTELCLSEFLGYGPQKETGKTGKSLLRKTKDGKIVQWNVEKDDSVCTLKDAFQLVEPSLGFNIELKFDDHIVYQQDYLNNVLQAILQVVYEYGHDRPIIFSSFQPDAALLVRELQNTYPVYFLTNGGTEIFYDTRRNSLEEAIKVCLGGGLHGIVSEVKGIFRNPGAVPKIKEAKLSLLTYGKLNNVSEAVYIQHLMGVNGVIVDLVREITEGVSGMIKPTKNDDEDSNSTKKESEIELKSNPEFSQKELSFLLKLIPQLIQE
ncbi:glycerophosphodiester phosphodiesterase GDPD1, chloroplastic-like [Mercurialis annua]|uniref:glycerophosphodiester phosphodiesterase GDPD1, chloroplastic-like n=1 Tax=Mercurialis annua TaxID=3986 RepID=UPI00215ED307|nr:glycerophosphodiester phosphodiesterase GDPD1, chloroplastic-like [Mercurialis annua]